MSEESEVILDPLPDRRLARGGLPFNPVAKQPSTIQWSATPKQPSFKLGKRKRVAGVAQNQPQPSKRSFIYKYNDRKVTTNEILDSNNPSSVFKLVMQRQLNSNMNPLLQNKITNKLNVHNKQKENNKEEASWNQQMTRVRNMMAVEDASENYPYILPFLDLSNIDAAGVTSDQIIPLLHQLDYDGFVDYLSQNGLLGIDPENLVQVLTERLEAQENQLRASQQDEKEDNEMGSGITIRKKAKPRNRKISSRKKPTNKISR